MPSTTEQAISNFNHTFMINTKMPFEKAKQDLVDISVTIIGRSLELMQIGSNGIVGTKYDIPELVMDWTIGLKEELAVRIMDKLMPDWKDIATKAIMETMLAELEAGTDEEVDY